MNGNLFIVSAPSGTGKTSILKQVINQVEQLEFSVSHTTRLPRKGEQDGRDYHFVSRQVFERMIDENAFLEWATVHDNYYGTALEPVEVKLRQGLDEPLYQSPSLFESEIGYRGGTLPVKRIDQRAISRSTVVAP